MNRWLSISSIVALALVGCGDDVSELSGATGAGGSNAASSGSGAQGGAGQGGGGQGGGSTGDWETLVEGDWTLQPGTEGYTCIVVTIPEEMHISAFRPVAPQGTHHTVLSKGASGNDGIFPCDAVANGSDMIYGSGVGTEALELPEGVAVKLEAGTKVMLNLHLFNATGGELSGLSGIQVKRLDAAEVQAESATVLAGTIGISIPAQGTKTETGHCTASVDTTVFAVGPHMHQYGTHMTVTAEQAGGDLVIHDEPYTFDDQRHYKLDTPLQLKAGERIKVDCTYNNPTAQQVGFGDSSLQEMCFASIFSYPPIDGQGVICIN